MNRHRWRVLVAAALIVGILYWLGGARIGTGVVQRQLQELLAGTTSQVLTFDHLSFNPFTLTARFTGLRVDDAETGPVLTVASGSLRPTFSGLFNNAIVVSDFVLDQPRLFVAVSNLPDSPQLHSLGGLQPAAGDDRSRPPVRVARVQITNGYLTVYDATESVASPTPMGIYVGDIKLSLNNVTSDAATEATFDLSARINESGELGVQGSWVPASHSVEASVQLSGLVLASFSTVFSKSLVDTQLAGLLALQGNFKHVAGIPGFSGELIIEELTVDNPSTESVLSASKLTAHGLKIGNGQPVANIEWLELDRPGVVLLVDDDGEFNLHPSIAYTRAHIDKVTVSGGEVDFTDVRLPSTVHISVDSITGELTRRVIDSEQALTISLTGALEDEGTATLDGVFLMNDGRVEADGNATLGGVDARTVSPYVASWVAREVEGGVMDLNLHYTLNEKGLMLSSDLVFADLELGAVEQGSLTLKLPVDMTVALLTDEHRRMVVELPVSVESPDSSDAIQDGFGDAVTRFINATTAAPMSVLSRLANVNADELSRFEYAVGSTEIRPVAEPQLAALVDALTRRPLLGVQVQGHYSERTDREALARRQVELHIGLAASTAAGHSTVASGLDFTDPKILAVLDEFAAARLNVSERNALTAATQKTGDETGTVGAPSYYPSVLEALVAKESVSDYALRQLARYRALSLVGRLQEMGIESRRLEFNKKATPVELDGAPPAVTLILVVYNPSDD